MRDAMFWQDVQKNLILQVYGCSAEIALEKGVVKQKNSQISQAFSESG